MEQAVVHESDVPPFDFSGMDPYAIWEVLRREAERRRVRIDLEGHEVVAVPTLYVPPSQYDSREVTLLRMGWSLYTDDNDGRRSIVVLPPDFPEHLLKFVARAFLAGNLRGSARGRNRLRNDIRNMLEFESV